MELPTMLKSTYASSSVDLTSPIGFVDQLQRRHQNVDEDILRKAVMQQALGQQTPSHQPIKEQKPMSTAARIVKVFIADPNDNLPLEKRILYKGDEILTDLTDQELFYEVPIAEMLAKHNDYRKTVVDKKQAEKFGRDIFLEPARIRDLRMVVVDVAKF